MFVLLSVIFELVDPRLRLHDLRFRHRDLRERRVVAGLRVLEILLGHQSVLERRLRAVERRLRDLQVALALDDRGFVDLEVGLRLVDLLLDVAVFHLRDLLALGDAVAHLHEDGLEPAVDARDDVDRRSPIRLPTTVMWSTISRRPATTLSTVMAGRTPPPRPGVAFAACPDVAR